MTNDVMTPPSVAESTRLPSPPTNEEKYWYMGRQHRWLLFAQDTPVARGGHGLARGLFYDLDGTLVASVVQESLMRSPRTGGEA